VRKAPLPAPLLPPQRHCAHTCLSSGRRLRSLWSIDGYRLYDKAEILPLVDQDSQIIACDKTSFPSSALSNKRSADDAGIDDVSDSQALELCPFPAPAYYALHLNGTLRATPTLCRLPHRINPLSECEQRSGKVIFQRALQVYLVVLLRRRLSHPLTA
jgi:hypothetical protein